MTIKPCTGEAHSNPWIDNCPVCAPRWGTVVTQDPLPNVHKYSIIHDTDLTALFVNKETGHWVIRGLSPRGGNWRVECCEHREFVDVKRKGEATTMATYAHLWCKQCAAEIDKAEGRAPVDATATQGTPRYIYLVTRKGGNPGFEEVVCAYDTPGAALGPEPGYENSAYYAFSHSQTMTPKIESHEAGTALSHGRTVYAQIGDDQAQLRDVQRVIRVRVVR